MTEKISKETFMKYESARKCGKYNMVFDAYKIIDEYGINEREYWSIIENYEYLRNKFI